MLRKKMLRDVLNNKSQFITILLMVMIGVMVYAGIEGYMAGMTKTADKFYTENNLQDINVIGSGFTQDDLEKIKKISDYITNIALVLFHPDDLKFIKDAPSTRRKTLNISISLIDISYLRALNQYQTLLKQRNAYLRQMAIDSTQPSDYLNILTTKLIEFGYEIYQKRLDFITNIQKYIADVYKKITDLDNLELLYHSQYDKLSKEQILELYNKNFEKDLKFGKTNVGIHMDDLCFLLDGKDLKDYGSEGQQKNAIIAYKFSELEIFKEKTGNYPLLILDDLFSELDVEKIEHILELLKPDVQTFITTTELNTLDFLKKFSYKELEINNGQVVKESNHGK